MIEQNAFGVIAVEMDMTGFIVVAPAAILQVAVQDARDFRIAGTFDDLVGLFAVGDVQKHADSLLARGQDMIHIVGRDRTAEFIGFHADQCGGRTFDAKDLHGACPDHSSSENNDCIMLPEREVFYAFQRNAGKIGKNGIGIGNIVRDLFEGVARTASVRGILVDEQCAAAPCGTAVHVFAALVDHDAIAFFEAGCISAFLQNHAHVLVAGNKRIPALFRMLKTVIGFHIGSGADGAHAGFGNDGVVAFRGQGYFPEGRFHGTLDYHTQCFCHDRLLLKGWIYYGFSIYPDRRRCKSRIGKKMCFSCSRFTWKSGSG